MLALHLLFLATGAAGLAYQVLWARQFGTLFGSAAGGAAWVTSLYMLGLGLGAHLGGTWADRLHARDARRPLRAFALAELAVGGWALAVGQLVPLLERPVAALSRYVVDDRGWAALSLPSELLRYGLGTALVLPATLLMGATLPLLIRHSVSVPGKGTGTRTGALYAVNTLGAALGAWATDAWLVPALGLQGTLDVACGVDLLVGLGAWVLAGRNGRDAHTADAEGGVAPREHPGAPSYEARAGPARLRPSASPPAPGVEQPLLPGESVVSFQRDVSFERGVSDDNNANGPAGTAAGHSVTGGPRDLRVSAGAAGERPAEAAAADDTARVNEAAVRPAAHAIPGETGAVTVSAAGPGESARLDRAAARHPAHAGHEAGPAPGSTGTPAWAVAAALALAGAAGMGLELAWYRYLGSVLGAYRAVFSQLLAVMLCAFVVGTVAAAAAERRWGRPAALFSASLAGLAWSAAACLALFDADAARESLAEGGGFLRAQLQVVALPALFMGASFPLAHALALTDRGTVGRRSGTLYLANTGGAVLGGLGTALLLVPTLGIQRTVAGLLGMLALATVPLSLGGPARGRAWPVVALLALMAWLALPPGLLLRRSFPILAQPEVKALALDEGTNESILVAEAPAGRALYTNGHSMSGTVWGSQRYMRAMAHVPLLLTEQPRRALVICFGVGNTAHAASLHPLESLEVVDLSRHVLEHAGHFLATNGNVLADSRVRVSINDGRQHLRMLPEGSLDLVTLEPPPIDFAGVAGLCSREFYALAASRLRPGGFITQWLPLYQVPPVVAVSLARAFVEVFPGATVLSGHGAELVLLGRKGEAVSGEFGAVARRMAKRPTVLEDMERMQLSSPEAWAGLPVLSPASLAALTADAVPLTDDWPISEYASAHRADLHRLDPAWFQPAPAAWCGPCAEAPGISRWVRSLAERYREAPFLEGAAFTLPAPLQPVR